MRARTAPLSLVFAALLAGGPVRAADHEVSPSDDLQAAVDALQPGDTLLLNGGVYDLGATPLYVRVWGTLDEPIRIVAGVGRPVLQGDPALAADAVFVTGADVVLEGFEVTGGRNGISVFGDRVTVRDCLVHEVGEAGLFVWSARNRFLRNEVRATGLSGHGAGILVRGRDHVVEGNWVHDLAGAHSLGIALECTNSVDVRDNVVHDIPYSGISADACDGAVNVVERNALWRLGLNGIQTSGFAVVRNNVVLGAAVNGIHVWSSSGLIHTGVDVVHNTVLFTGLEGAVTLNGVDEVRVASNALYAPGREAIRVVDSTDVSVAGNVGSGSFSLGGPGFACCGAVALDFVAANLSGAPPNDPFPAPGSPLVGAGSLFDLVADDFNGTPREGTRDAGAYRFDAAGNPGWALQEGFKAPEPGAAPLALAAAAALATLRRRRADQPVS